MNIIIYHQLLKAMVRFQKRINSKSNQIRSCPCPIKAIQNKLLTSTNRCPTSKLLTQKLLNTHQTLCQALLQTNLSRYRCIRQRTWAGTAKVLVSKFKITMWISTSIALVFNTHNSNNMQREAATCIHRCPHSITWWTVPPNNWLLLKALRLVSDSRKWVP